MKKITLIYFTFIFSFQLLAQFDTILHPGQVNIATLIVDYQTHYYEGGNMSHYNCSSCSGDSIPLDILYESPSDFGSMTFRLAPSLDTFFYGSIVWMGEGQINYPSTFTTSAPFNYSATSVVYIPEDLIYLRNDGQPLTDPGSIDDANSAWSSISDLNITEIFNNYGFKAAVYAYAPAVGTFDPDPAKWIIFLYQNELTSGLNSDRENELFFDIYPNPANDFIEITNASNINGAMNYSIVDNLGKKIQSGEIDFSTGTIDVSTIPAGYYYLNAKCEIDNSVYSKKLILVK